MTVIISLPHSKMIIMTADSRKTTKLTRVNFELQPISQSIEYTTMTKVFPVPGAGCVTLWGDDVTRAEHGFPRYLGKHRSTVESIEDLRVLVERYLEDDLQAEQDGADVGFHVGGFAPDG